MKTNKKNIVSLLYKSVTTAEKFHHATEIKKKQPELPFTEYPEEWKKVYYKSYARLDEIQLPPPKDISPYTLTQALSERASVRSFSTEPLSLTKLSTILYYGAGLKPKNSQGTSLQRFYPSAGGRYPLEVYLLSLNSELPKGLYHYYVKNHSLEKLKEIEKNKISDYFNQPWIEKAGCIIFITSVFKRNTIKYGDRGYRYMLTEAGHLGQNIYLLSSTLQLACCANESFIDTKINSLLNLNETQESVIYTLALGNLPT